jgi:hypothetical protein
MIWGYASTKRLRTPELDDRELRELFPKAAKEGLTNIANELIIHGADVNSCIGINLNV